MLQAGDQDRYELMNVSVNITLGAMDKVTTATAALYGFRADTGLTGDRYSWVGSAFNVSKSIQRRICTANGDE